MDKKSALNGISIIDNINLDEVQGMMRKINTFQSVIQANLKPNHDYGNVPGVNKPMLFKAGGEKICMMFGLNPEYEFISATEDYKGGFFSYNIKCTLHKKGMPCAQGIGLCNSKEKKYRYVTVDSPPEGYAGESLQFTDSYGFVKYKIENPDIYSLVNTILKMAKKRAFLDAVLQVASLSEIFMQDLDDAQNYARQEQQAASVTPEQAGAIRLRFGKYKGKSLKELYKEDREYFNWLSNAEKTDPSIKKACEIMISAVRSQAKRNSPPHEQNSRIQESAIDEDMPYDDASSEGMPEYFND